jgi:hypothetical protein
MNELQKYDLIKPLGEFKPMGPISHVEIQPVKEYDDYCEPCNVGDEDFWSVYVRYDPSKNDKHFGGVDCIADCSDFDAAVRIANLVSGLLGVEVVGA